MKGSFSSGILFFCCSIIAGVASAYYDVLRVDWGSNNTLRTQEAGQLGGKWPRGRVPYKIDRSVQAETRAKLMSGIRRIHAVSCIRLVPKTNRDRNYLLFESNPDHGRCRAVLGYRADGEQYANFVESCTEGSIIHETMHSLGFLHEMVREDRDEYVTVHLSKIQESHKHNFIKSKQGTTLTYGVKYNYESILHYSKRTGFEIKGYRGNAIDVKEPHPSALGNPDKMGQRTRLTPGDIYMLNARYDCPKPWNKKDPGSSSNQNEEEEEQQDEDCLPPQFEYWAPTDEQDETENTCLSDCQQQCRGRGPM